MGRIQEVWESIQLHIAVWQAAWRAEKKRGKATSREWQEMEFLPAALEIQERPPHPMARAIAGTIIALFFVAVVWASISEVDIVAIAHGKIIPDARIKSVQPLEIGVVRAIHVKEGQSIKQGQLLLELDTTNAEADTSKLRYELDDARGEQLRIKALLAAIDAKTAAHKIPRLNSDEISPPQLQRQNELLSREYSEHRARLGAYTKQISGQQAEREAISHNLNKLRTTLPLLEKRVNAYQSLSDQKLVPEMQYLELEQQRIEQVHEIAASSERVREIQLKIEQSELELRLYQEEYRRKLLTALFEVERQFTSSQSDLTKSQRRGELQQLRAPVDGIVQEVTTHTVGGVVTPAQILMKIVPNDAALTVEAWVENQDIGFVNVGQQAAIKIDTFPFTKYGTIEGVVENLSMDAVEKEKAGLIYAARIVMNKMTLDVDGKKFSLAPGMTVVAEVKTGKRRVIEYLLSPLIKMKDEAVHER